MFKRVFVIMKELVLMLLIFAALTFALFGCLGSGQVSKKEGYETSKPKRVTESQNIYKEKVQPQYIAPVLKTVYFDLNSDKLRSDARVILQENARILRNHPELSVVLEGHCDERGNAEFNLKLGDKRAKAVKEYLESLGIRADRLTTITYGKDRLIDRGSTEEAHKKNRRVDFKIRYEVLSRMEK